MTEESSFLPEESAPAIPQNPPLSGARRRGETRLTNGALRKRKGNLLGH